MGGRFWKILLVVGTVLEVGTSSALKKPLSYKEAVELGVELYNKRSGEEFQSRLLKALPQPQWDPNSKLIQKVNFFVEETVCRAEDQIEKDKCDFKDDGLVRECLGYYLLEETPPVTLLICEKPELKPIMRSFIKDFMKRKFKKFWDKGKEAMKIMLSGS